MIRAIVLARGLGTRMREPDAAAGLSPEQHRAADAGLKAMLPVNGRPFVDYLLNALADAGVREAALVIAPDQDAIRRHYADAAPSRIQVSFVVQQEPLGTANAVLAAESWIAGEPFLAMNADNLYPAGPLRDLAVLDEPGFLAFDADDLVRSSNIPADRLRAFARVEVDPAGYLVSIVEKPADLPPDALVSMNCWRLDQRIFAACRAVPKSPRGEYELPEAVGVAAGRGVRFRAVPARGPVLDLSRRADAADVARRLTGIVPCP